MAKTFPVNKEIGARIKRARVLKEMSQADLGLKIGHKSSSYIFYLECGLRHVKAEILYRISKVLEMPINYFFDSVYETENSKILTDYTN